MWTADQIARNAKAYKVDAPTPIAMADGKCDENLLRWIVWVQAALRDGGYRAARDGVIDPLRGTISPDSSNENGFYMTMFGLNLRALPGSPSSSWNFATAWRCRCCTS